MSTTDNKAREQVWDLIDREKKRDKMIRRVSRIAWGTTLVILLVFLVFTIKDVTTTFRLYKSQIVAAKQVWKALVPFAIVLGSVSLIVGVLSTIGVFLRLRTTSLLEVQQRLANLEQLITSEK